MKVMGFNFTKISIEKFSDNFKDLNIKTNIDVVDMNEIKADSFKIKEDLIGVKFEYNVDYGKEIAKIDFAGNILFAIDSKEAKEILKKWKDKKIQEEFRVFLFNVILRKSNLKCLQLEEELNIPLHVPLPTIRKQENSDK